MITSGIYSFSKILESVRQETGIKNLTNEYPSIRKMIFDAVFDINPWGALLVRKRMIYYKGNGNFDGKNIKKPDDFVMIDKMGCCKDKICNLFETVSHFVICDKTVREKVAFTYWAVQCDGEGNPITTNNHAPAVVAYLVYKMYAPKIFMGEGSLQVKKDYERYYEDRALEARGHDVFPSDHALYEMRKLAAMTSKEMDASYCKDLCSSSSHCLPTTDDNPIDMTNKVWFWQYENINQNIDSADDITDEFLEEQEVTTLSALLLGGTFNYAFVGRIGFCIEDVSPDDISIFDIIGSDMRKTFNYFYDFEKRRLVVISNDYISQSSIYFKFQHNG